MKKIVFIAFILIITACGKKDSTDKKTELEKLKKEQSGLKEKIAKLEAELAAGDSTRADKIKIVSVTEMAKQPFTHFIEVQARVEGEADVNVGAEMMGTVTAVLVKEGDKVSTGQVLAKIDDKMIQQNIAEVQTQLDLAVTVYNRQKNLWEQKIGSEVQYLQAKANKEGMEKKMNSMHEQWDRTRIKSPINGTVDDVSIKVGQEIAPGMTAVRVVNLSLLKVKGEVAESYFPDDNKEVKTKLSYSGQVINKLNRTFNVEVHIDSKETNIHPNQVVVLKIADYSSSTFIVPVGAIQKSSDGEFVYIASNENGKTIAKRKVVTSGFTYNGLAEIKNGISEGDRIITNGYQNVVEGDPIKL
jgi:RND family efflux transporter MFP subunit